jgi:predicted small lipoprotein YifL
VLVALALCAACGKKGPPLPPLNMAPEAPQAVTARRLGDTVYVQLTVPAKNISGSGPYSVDHLEIFAATLAPGSAAPNRDFLKPAFVVTKIPIRKPVDPEAEAVENAPGQNFPAPGEVMTWVETLSPALLAPQQVSKPAPAAAVAAPPAAAAPAPAAPGAAAVPPPPSAPAVVTRIYAIRGVAANGSAGAPSTRVAVPLVDAPAPPRPGAASFGETSVTITWTPPPVASDEASGVAYNVYAAAPPDPGGASPSAPLPLNAAPLEVTSYTHEGAVAGQEQCFVVRSAATVGTMTVESDPSAPICVTPADTFPPKAPTGLAAVSGPGVINLIWDANSDADLAGYLVLRGEAAGDTLQPLTPQPIRETRYVDRAVQPGVTYVYAVIAVDRAATPNRSALSNRVQETAR